jgi:Holliday junction resolvase RusA-like endonuclease
MIEVVRFWVPGNPKTKGSLDVINSGRGSGGRAVLQDAPASKRWRKMVAYGAGAAMSGVTQAFPLGGLVGIVATYWLPVWSNEELIAQGSGDIDKLDRNILDALQDAGIYGNDAQVVQCNSVKLAAAGRPDGAGALVVIGTWE